MTPGSVDRAAVLRRVPPVHALVAEPPDAVRTLGAGERLERAALDHALEAVREDLVRSADSFAEEGSVRAAVERRWTTELEALLRPALGPLVNATGVVVHTNLGRAPLAWEVAEAAVEAGARYTPLEYDLEAGERGSRYDHAAPLLELLTGAEEAIVVNNNAAALLVAVDTLAAGRSVVLSRGELIEIGGGFRVHEIVAASRARVLEVGATNKTHPDDYRRALETHDVGAILKVHRSNFAQTGFVAEVELEALCRIAEPFGVPVVFDQGTGLAAPLKTAPDEPLLGAGIEAGATLVCGSGDKLLGGPQSGLLVGRSEAIARVRKNPLLRALRVDKMTLAALDATLRTTLADPAAIPVRRMVERPAGALRDAAESLLDRLNEAVRAGATVAAHEGRTGGGTLPGVALAGWAIRLTPETIDPEMSPTRLASLLRDGAPPIVARVADGAVWIDPRTMLDGEEGIVAGRLNEILSRGGPT